VSFVSSDEKDETYWLGVRDALRMVDSFVRWSARHEDKAKNLQEFISEGLIAAAKRCESCLSTTLGLTFGESLGGLSSDDLLEPADPTDRLSTHYEELAEEKDSTVPDDEVLTTEESSPEPKFESESEASSEVEPTSIEAIERTKDIEIEDMQPEGPPRDFGTDFDLGEPSPLTIEPEDEDQESSVSEASEPEEPSEPEQPVEIEDALAEPEHIDVIKDEADDAPPSTESGLTWSEYERVTTPLETTATPTSEEHAAETEPSEMPVNWSPNDESIVSADEAAEDLHEEQDEVDKEVPEIEPPPPPPPPESDESEEERRRRARRLFFGT